MVMLFEFDLNTDEDFGAKLLRTELLMRMIYENLIDEQNSDTH